jgi:3-methyladenine DNA glycosylase/8-oxoguanine DNA glycosylase
MSQNTRSEAESTKPRPHQLLNTGQRSIERRGVATARLRKIRASAAAAANLCGNRTH